jgi:hypothetical protein
MTDAINPPEGKRSNFNRFLMYGLLGLAVVWIFYQYMSPSPQPVQVAYLTYPAEYEVDSVTGTDYFWDRIPYWEVVRRQWVGAAVIYQLKKRHVFSVQLQNPATSDREVTAVSAPQPSADGLSAAGERQRLAAGLTRSLWLAPAAPLAGRRRLVAKLTIPREKKAAQLDLPADFRPLPDTRVVLRDASGRVVGVGVLETP